MKLEQETLVREEAIAAAQTFDEVNQECAQYGNQVRDAEMRVQKTDSELRYYKE